MNLILKTILFLKKKTQKLKFKMTKQNNEQLMNKLKNYKKMKIN